MSMLMVHDHVVLSIAGTLAHARGAGSLAIHAECKSVCQLYAHVIVVNIVHMMHAHSHRERGGVLLLPRALVSLTAA